MLHLIHATTLPCQMKAHFSWLSLWMVLRKKPLSNSCIPGDTRRCTNLPCMSRFCTYLQPKAYLVFQFITWEVLVGTKILRTSGWGRTCPQKRSWLTDGVGAEVKTRTHISRFIRKPREGFAEWAWVWLFSEGWHSGKQQDLDSWDVLRPPPLWQPSQEPNCASPF